MLFKMFDTRKFRGDTTTGSRVSFNLFIKIVTFVALIIYQHLTILQQVSARPKGLIYNKDGKFIYRPPKAGQGHIIVIDDRHRDSRSDASVPAPALGSESIFQGVQLISPRLYHPGGGQLAAAVPVRVSGFPQGAAGSIQLIGIAPAKINGYPMASSAMAEQRSISSGQLVQPSIQSPTQFQVIPVMQLYTTNGRAVAQGPSTLASNPQIATAYVGGPDLELYGQNLVDPSSSPLQQHQQQQQPQQYQHQLPFNYQPAVANRKAFEADTQAPVGGYDVPQESYDLTLNSAFMDDPKPPFNQPATSRVSSGSGQQNKVPSDIDYIDESPLYDDTRQMRQMNEQSKVRQARQPRNDRMVPGLLNPLTGSPMEQRYMPHSNSARAHPNIENLAAKNFKLAKRSSTKPKLSKGDDSRKLFDNLKPEELFDMNKVREANEERQYWKQYKDHYDILQ